jgi:hypothetical protein
MWSNVTVTCLSALLRTIGERRATQLLPNLDAAQAGMGRIQAATGWFPVGKWLPTRLLAWSVGALPQHAVPRKASGRIVVLGRAVNDP